MPSILRGLYILKLIELMRLFLSFLLFFTYRQSAKIATPCRARTTIAVAFLGVVVFELLSIFFHRFYNICFCAISKFSSGMYHPFFNYFIYYFFCGLVCHGYFIFGSIIIKCLKWGSDLSIS